MRWYRRFFRRESTERQLDAELRFHLEQKIADLVASGITPDEARRRAQLEFGGLDQVKEECRDVGDAHIIESFIQDLRYGARMLRKSPGFAAVAVVTLALGIGATTAIFSMVNAVLLKSISFPFKDPDRLVNIYAGDPLRGFDDDISPADYLDWKARNRSFQQMAAFEGVWFILTGGEPQRLHGDYISADWLPTLGVEPAMGRNFSPEEERQGVAGVVILSNDGWRHRFNGDPNILGKKLALNGQTYTVAGVLPPSFNYDDREVFAPLVTAHYSGDHSQALMNFHTIARLKPGITLAQAQAEMTAIARQLEVQYPATNKGREVKLVTLRQQAEDLPPTPRRMHDTLWLMLGAVGLVMLAACANVAGLLLVRGITRTKEFAVRAALGSTRARITRQTLTETVLLFLCGGAAGLVLALWSRDLLARTVSIYLFGAKVPVDARVFLFSLTVSLVTGVTFGLAPAFQAARLDLNDALKDSLKVFGRWHRNRTYKSLVVSEIALALVLMIGFGLLLRSFLHMMSAPLGFNPANVVTISASLDQPQYAYPAQRLALAHSVLEKVSTLPGVRLVGITDRLPLQGAAGMWFSIEGRRAQPEAQESELKSVVTTVDLFRALEIPLLEGRMFTEHDTSTSPPVIIVNSTLARRFFPGENPIGRRLRMGDSPSVSREVVGVVTDVRQRNLDEDSAPIAYRPWDQAPQTELSLALRVTSSADIPAVTAALHGMLRTLDKNQVWDTPITMEKLIDESESVSLRRPVVRLLGAFGIVALTLGAVGLYGVVSYFVTQRTREFGIRLALGAGRDSIFSLVLGQMARLAAVGIGIGIAAALVLTRFLPSGPIGWAGATVNLYGVSRADFLTYIGFVLLLALVMLLASCLPARRATNVDPMVALRHE